MLLCLAVLLSGGWSLRPRPQAPPLSSGSPAMTGSLREVSPPKGSQALRQRLAEHQPRLRILAPADDTVLPVAPWALELALDDWPLTDAGALGLGAHLVVQLDDQEPLRLGPDAAGTPVSQDNRLSVAMAPLSPGSHRLTIYAARPWGEAVKDPGAATQLRLHGLAANPLSQPRRGTPQLVSSTPSDLIHHEPALIDWLLIDAPLQRLAGDGSLWRLRVTLNGDSFQVDRQEPLWLTGLHPGSNPLQLELLDGLGEPLNPPFNSLVQNLEMRPESPPPWQRASISGEDLERLLGERPENPAEEVAMETEPDPEEVNSDVEEEEPVVERRSEPEASPDPEDAEDDSSLGPGATMVEPVQPMKPAEPAEPTEPLAVPEASEWPASEEPPLDAISVEAPSDLAPDQPAEELLAEPVLVPAGEVGGAPEAKPSALERLRARFGG
ncbi:hypothetical protein KQ304_10455 [Synechococcus sp. CS-1329]|nr:hypothetical protein [Synechococcus sp. CS-1329]